MALRATDPELRDAIARILSSAGHDVREVGGPSDVRVSTPAVVDLVVIVCDHDDDPSSVAAATRTTRARAALYVLATEAEASLAPAGAPALTLPCSRTELLAGVDAARDAVAAPSGPELPFEVSGLRIDEAMRVTVDGAPVRLTRIERRLLFAVLRTPGEPVSRRELLVSVWNMQPEIDTRTIDTHVTRLRQKLASAGERLTAVRRLGYAFRVDDAMP